MTVIDSVINKTRSASVFDGERSGGGQRIDADGEGRRLVENAAAADLDPDQVVADDVDLELFTVQLGEQA